jgi:tRNA-2-methylthio-N6-dimethylallyladenosine synthase
MCSYCIVPYVRGRERSRDPHTIIREVEQLAGEGYREITLIGQNVDSYKWKDARNNPHPFAWLLEQVAKAEPGVRIRFATSHPKDLSNEVLEVMARHPNICRHIHLPVQSGSNGVLKAMNRRYTREWYMNRIDAIRSYLPEAEITTDVMAGFPGETHQDHRDTLSLMEYARYDFAYMFAYSERPGTRAARKMTDDVPDHLKKQRLQEIINLQNQLSAASKEKAIGKTFRVLVEGPSKKSEDDYQGRNSQNQVVVFPREDVKTGDFADVKVEKSTPGTLIGRRVHNQ